MSVEEYLEQCVIGRPDLRFNRMIDGDERIALLKMTPEDLIVQRAAALLGTDDRYWTNYILPEFHDSDVPF